MQFRYALLYQQLGGVDIEQVTDEQVEAWPNLKERTDLDTLYRDGGFGSPAVDKNLVINQVEQIQTAIRGRIPISEKLKYPISRLNGQKTRNRRRSPARKDKW